MITHTLKKLPKHTFEILIDVTWDEIEKEYKNAFDVLLAEFSFQGFRKGKVPRTVAEKHIPKDKIYSQLIKTLIPKVYEEIVKKEQLKPIVSPKIELIKAKEKETWQIKTTLAEKPTVDLGEYKKKIADAKTSFKKNDIWVPGKEEVKKEDTQAINDKILNAILNVLLTEVKCEIPPLLIESELNRKLTTLVDDVQKIGLTMENYLQSKGTTIDKLKEQYTKEITDMYKLEFILLELADKEHIKVEQKDLDTLFENLKNEKEKEAAKANAYFYASILRKQKTLDYLISL